MRSDRPDDDDHYDDDGDETKANRENDIKKTCARDRHEDPERDERDKGIKK